MGNNSAIMADSSGSSECLPSTNGELSSASPSVSGTSRRQASAEAECEESDMERLNEKLKTIKLSDLVVKRDPFATGTWAKLFLVQLRDEPNRSFALKQYRKSKIKRSDRQAILREKRILSTIDCGFIMKYHTTFQNNRHLYILLDLYQGGELFALIPAQNENAAKFYAACLVEALGYLHARNIIHRDFKPENVVSDKRGYLRLVDFGLSKQLKSPDDKAYSIKGTRQYFAPEVVRLHNRNRASRGYNVAVDLWALGLVIYEILNGFQPFDKLGGDDDRENLYDAILKGIDVLFPDQYVPANAQDLIQQLCRMEPAQRLGYKGQFDDIRKHSWFHKFDWESLRNKTLPAPTVPKLESSTDVQYFKNSCDNDATKKSSESPQSSIDDAADDDDDDDYDSDDWAKNF